MSAQSIGIYNIEGFNLDAEAAAQSSRLGVWGLPDQVKPWDWRRGKRDKS